MKPILTQLFAGLFLLLASQVFGQATMTTNFVVTSTGPYPIGSHIVVELRVTNFTNIESMQFPIVYNKAAMKFDSLTNPVFPNWSAGNFVSVPAAGKVGISWDGYSNGANSPFSFPNGTAIFKLHFTGLDNGVGTVNISAAAAPPAIDIVGNNGQVGILNYQSGGTPPITVGTGNPPPPPLVGFKIVANSIYIPQGERGCMPVTVNDFDNILSMQWAMHWDNAVLNFECTRSYNLSGWSAGDFNSVYSAGTLLAGWADPAGAGVTHVDGARIVDVCFKAIGAPGANTTVTIDGIGMPPTSGSAEAYNAASINVWSTGGVNGASGVSAPLNIIITPPAPSDVTYTVDTIPVAPNTIGCVAVKVKNFTAITRSEFALSYNPAELTYSSVQFGANPLNLQVSNTTHVANPGVVKFLWANANGASVANDATIFSACFTVIAPPGTKANVNFTSTPCPLPNCNPCNSITGIGTAMNTGGVSMARNNGWIKSVPSGPTLNKTDVTCNGGSDGTITLINPPSTNATGYAWAGPGINGTNIGQQNQTGLPAGTYTVTVTYSGGSTGTGTAIINQPAAALAQTNTVNTVSCFNGSNGAINLTPSGGTAPYTYLWSNGSTAQDPSGLPVGVYTVTITDSKGCTLVAANISVSGFIAIALTSPGAVATSVTCAGLSTGSIEINPTGGSGGYTYDWSNDGQEAVDNDPKNLSSMPAGTYTVTVTDSNGCTSSFTSTIGSPPPLVSSLVSKTDVKCFGTATGTATIAASGGTGALNFCWTTGVGPCKDPTGLLAGTYTAIVTDQNGCTSTVANVVISNPPGPLAVSGTTTDSPCFDQASGAINTNTTGGWINYQYAWSGPISPISPVPNPSPLPGGIYTVTVTDASQCTSTQTFTIVGSPAIVKNEAFQLVTCFGGNDGSIDLHLSGGNPPYNVVWNNNVLLTGEFISNLAAGSYQPVVTDGQGCTKIFPAVLLGSTPEIAEDKDVQPVTCFGVNNGGITLNLSGGNPPYDVVWTNTTLTGESIGNLTPNSYQPTVTDLKGCTKIFPAVVITGPAGAINTVNAVVTETGQNGGSIDLNPAGGTGNPDFWNYSWSGPNGFTSVNQDISGPSVVVGTYTVIITDANACTLSFTFYVPEGNLVANAEVLSVVNTCNQDGCILLNIPPTAAAQTPFTLDWGFGTMQTDLLTPSICGLVAGTYIVTVTAANGNSVVLSTLSDGFSPIEIDQLTPVSVDAVSQNPFDEQHDGKITLTPVGGQLLQYQWGPPLNSTSSLVTGLDSGLYVVTITNGTSFCTSVRYYQLKRQYQTLVVSPNLVSNPNCSTVASGAIDIKVVGGNDPYNYSWTGPNGFVQDTQDINGLMPGFYSVTVSDYNDTIRILTFTLTSQSNLDITNVNETSLFPSGHQVSGANMCDGEASVVFIPGLGTTNIVWSNGVTGINNTTLCGGPYSVTVTDAANCSSVWTGELTAPPAITSSQESVGVKCHADCDGSAKVFVQGGFAPYKVIWSTGQTDQAVFPNGFSQAVNLCGGDYTVTITDKNGAETITTINVDQPAEIALTFATTTPRSFNACDGDILFNVSGAALPITYFWGSDFHTGDDERAEGLCSGEIVFVTITDANGCEAVGHDSVPFPEDGCFRVSPVITPGQQDGKNDNIYITCIETTLENHIEIYNRWGQLVFQTDGYTNEDSDREHNWNGLTDSGASFAEGVYYYVLTYTFRDDQGALHDEVRKGAINLLQ